MAHFGGPLAALFGQTVQAVSASAAFDGSSEQAAFGRMLFAGIPSLANGDTLSYVAISADDPRKWEAGVMTYVLASKTWTRSDANVHYSSASGSRVDFRATDLRGANVVLLGKDASAYLNAWTITAPGATRTFAGSETTAATIAAALALLINDLKAAGVVA